MELKGNGSGQVNLFVGIDAGQTHTEAVLLDAGGNRLAEGKGGTSHLHGADMADVFRQALAPALAFLDSGFSRADIKAVGIGVTGIGIRGKRAAVETVMREFFPYSLLLIENDAVASHWGASGARDGTSVLAGTGTIIYGEYLGQTCRMGGYGYLFGDEGGGFWIGQKAVRVALLAAEGSAPRSETVRRIEAYFGVDNALKIPSIVYGQSPLDMKRIAELTELIAACAAEGDRMAAGILLEAADELSELTLRLLKRLKVDPSEPYPVYRLGGVWRVGPLVVDRYSERVKEVYRCVLFPEPKHSPAVGAALTAISQSTR